MLSLILATSALLLGFVGAQGPTTNFSTQPIIQNVDLTTRNSWCTSQYSTCGTLCGGQVDSNNCTGTDLTYSCTCTSNHSAPALQYYAGSLINFICHRSLGDCFASHANDLAGQKQCNSTFTCSDIKAEAQAASSSSASSSAASATATSSSTSSPSPSATKSAALKIGQDYGMGILAVAVLGMFGFAL